MIERYRPSAQLNQFFKLLKSEQSILVEGLWETPKALLAIFAAIESNKSVLLLTGGPREDKLIDNILQFFPSLPLEFPAWETLPGDEIPPSPDIIGKRMETLYHLIHKNGPSIVLCPIASFLQKLPAKELLSPYLLKWKIGSKISFEKVPEILSSMGYKRAPVVTNKGEFAIRGGIVDLFPISSSDPFRVDFFGDEIDQIKSFDPIGQKSIQKIETFSLFPADELAFVQTARRHSFIGDYLGDSFILMWDDLLKIEDAYVSLQSMPGARSPFLYKLEDLLKKIGSVQHLFCSSQKLEDLSTVHAAQDQIRFEMISHYFEASRFFHPFLKVADYFIPPEETAELLDVFHPAKNLHLYFLNATETEENDLKQKLQPIKLPKTTYFERGYLTSGFVLSDIPLAVITNFDITHKERIRRQKWRSTYHTPAAEFHQLTPGDLVVHFHSGIGKYLGIEKQINHLGAETEFLLIEYEGGSKLFVPFSQAYLISRYIGTKESPPSLSELGSKRWHNIRQKAMGQIVGYAAELLDLYAHRSLHGGFIYPPDSDLMKQFESDFPYEETHDQLLAIASIDQDMMSEKAMDRIVCGDVGYGKTEVAMRAAFKAVVDGHKQVAVLVPTTVLAMQHFDTFSERMRGYPVKVDVVSRFRKAKQIGQTLEEVRKGSVDILIGTHRILSNDVQFKDLGLIIIDEEQRFGVKAKEHLKKMKVGVDCITLSATPIPRTLYMSLIHAKDMSVISTPPQDRLPIKTIIAETDSNLIENALLREFARGGQAFFIHNRVETIYSKASQLQKLVPKARIGIVHGQLETDEIDSVFHQFKQGLLDLLVATTIVETGVDIPNANTLLIDRADTYGLADLYQLRGRVGRWNRTAYAYFLIPKKTRLPELTQKRLNALVEASGYGGGMKIAMRDLEIRGAGDILGEQQSGQVSNIGFHLYCKLLKKAIDALKKQKTISFEETKMEFSYDAKLPEFYINEVSIRMELYYRLGEASTFQELDTLLAEIEDRFGPAPEPVFWLYHLSKIRIFATANGFTLLKFGALSLLAQQQLPNHLEKKNILLPKKVQTPKALEEYVIANLKKNFNCTKEII